LLLQAKVGAFSYMPFRFSEEAGLILMLFPSSFPAGKTVDLNRIIDKHF